MTQAPGGGPRRFRTVFISDLHLGCAGCSADRLLEFLHGTHCDQLYLVGDIIDIWALQKKRFWPQAHNDVVRALLGKARHGTRVTYIPGNHDELLRHYAGHRFGNIEIVERAVHRTADGRALLVVHGDEFDAVVRSSRWLGLLGSTLYELLLRANTLVNLVRRLCGFPRWSLAAFLKQKVKNAVQYISRYEEAVAFAARRHGVQGVICGHIHRPEIARFGAIEYHNCGDWVESCTALVEHADGRIELLRRAQAAPAAGTLRAAA